MTALIRKITALVSVVAMTATVVTTVPQEVMPQLLNQVSVVSEAANVNKVTGLNSRTLSKDKILLSWNKVSGADGYYVGMRKNGQYPQIADVTTNSYLVTGLPPATRENFKVMAYKIVNGKKVYGNFSDNWNTATNPRPITGLTATTENGKVQLSWNKVGCTDYVVFTTVNGKWVTVGRTKYNYYTATNLDAGEHQFRVRACKTDDKPLNHYGAYSQSVTADFFNLDKVTGVSSRTLSNTEIKLSWNAVEGADGYCVGMRKNGLYPEVGDTTDTSFTVSNLPSATRENFKIMAYKIVDGEKVYGELSENWNTATNPRQVTGLKIGNVTASSVSLSWNKVGCSNYRVFQLKNGSWKQIAQVTGNTYTVNGLKASSTYQFKVRACKVDDKPLNHYGKYSSAVSAKTDKQTIETVNGITYVNGILVANKTYSLPKTYNPGGLTAETSAAFTKMQQAAYKDGINLWVASGYRSYYYQQTLYNNYVAYDGKANADTYSARPGHSEHQTGLALDVNRADMSFDGTKEAKWLAAHCTDYGFIIRYPKSKQSVTGFMYEPWHIRYLGVDNAKTIAASGLCLEEYLGINSVYNY